MPTPARHIIQRQTVWLDTPGQPPSFGLQDRVSAYCRNQLPAVLESLFDRLSDTDTTLRLDQLTIDVGNLSLVRLEDELTQRITQQVEQAFRQVSEQEESTVTNSFGSAGGQIIGSIERVSRSERMAQQIRHFLLFGRLPGWTDIRDFDQLDQWLTTPPAAPFRQELIEMLHTKPELISRLIHHSTDQALISLAFNTGNHGIGVSNVTLSGGIRLLLTAIQELTQLPVQLLRERYWQGALRKAATEKANLTSSLITFQKSVAPPELPSLFFSRLRLVVAQYMGKDTSPAATLLVQTLSNLIETNASTTQSPNTQQHNEQTDGTANEQKKAETQPGHTDLSALAYNQIPAKTAGVHSPTTESPASPPAASENSLTINQEPAFPARTGHSSGRTTTSTQPSDEAGLFVTMAGVVLLHPFLMPLFSEMGLVVNRQWADDTAATRGVQTLAFLATGLDYCPEYDMTLLKLLCGLPFDSLVSPYLSLTDTDRQNATELLDAVIGYWPALGTVSADGLREAFLQREGKLIRADAGWQLTVERKTIDILMNKFPWGFSAVKLPFMPDLLLVDWT